MMERLEKFHAPKSWRDFVPGAIILSFVLLMGCLERHSSVTDAQVIAEKSQQAVAAERDRVLPMAHPLGCPEEDALGRPLISTMSVIGDRRPRCNYSFKLVRK